MPDFLGSVFASQAHQTWKQGFAICCGYTGFLYAFEEFTGKRDNDNSKVGIVTQLIKQAGLIVTTQGHILFTDNFYMSIEQMKEMYNKFGMLLVGTIYLTAKNS